MQLIDSITSLRAYIKTARSAGKSIGLVPTMGALHEGHISLIEAAGACDVVVVSIFVNPLQFNKQEDFDNYPIDLKGDLQMLESRCDVVFAPSASEMYATETLTTLSFGNLASTLEGKFRPGHFSGVGLIVTKLFNIAQPDVAYFGLKDLQQYLIIKQMTKDLSMDVQIVGCPIVREKSGLAMSSRNRRLSSAGLDIASNIHVGLMTIVQGFNAGHSLLETKKHCESFYASISGLQIEYLELVDEQMNILYTYPANGAIIACVAAIVEGVRLIDNVYLRSE